MLIVLVGGDRLSLSGRLKAMLNISSLRKLSISGECLNVEILNMPNLEELCLDNFESFDCLELNISSLRILKIVGGSLKDIDILSLNNLKLNELCLDNVDT